MVSLAGGAQLCCTQSQESRSENTSTPSNISNTRDRFFFHFKMTSRAVTSRPPLLPTGLLKTLLPDAECMSNVRTDNLPFSYSCTLHPNLLSCCFSSQTPSVRSSGLFLTTQLHRHHVRTSWPNAGSGRHLPTEPDIAFYFIKH